MTAKTSVKNLTKVKTKDIVKSNELSKSSKSSWNQETFMAKISAWSDVLLSIFGIKTIVKQFNEKGLSLLCFQWYLQFYSFFEDRISCTTSFGDVKIPTDKPLKYI